MRQLKHHEQRLLKKANFYEWKADKGGNIRAFPAPRFRFKLTPP